MLKLLRLCWGAEAKPTGKSRQALRSSPSSTSSPAMPPKINGSTMADLVKQAVQKEVTSQLNKMQEMLQSALSRITSLEEEIVKCNTTPRAPRLPSSPSSSSSVCRHWLRNRCTWKDQCRFSHGGETSDAGSEGSYAVVDNKDLEEVERLTKVAEETSSSSSCEVKLPSSEIVGCLLKSNLPPRHQPVSCTSSLSNACQVQADVKFQLMPSSQ